jgi:hypothetical protein
MSQLENAPGTGNGTLCTLGGVNRYEYDYKVPFTLGNSVNR